MDSVSLKVDGVDFGFEVMIILITYSRTNGEGLWRL